MARVLIVDDSPSQLMGMKLIIERLGHETITAEDGAQGVEEYRSMGYLPVALRNYLVRLGWSHGDDEIMSTAQLIEWFNLDAIGRSPARFDFAKLAW